MKAQVRLTCRKPLPNSKAILVMEIGLRLDLVGVQIGNTGIQIEKQR